MNCKKAISFLYVQVMSPPPILAAGFKVV